MPGAADSRAAKSAGSRTPFGMTVAPAKTASSVKTPSCPSGPLATRAATEVPAKIAGREDVGRLEPGAEADVLVLSDELELQRVLAAGEDVL